jgi:glycosyltransferase involved in cell wall biosynthesis
MKISVIIPYRDRPEALSRTLASIRAYWPAGEIIVVDDDSELPVGPQICRQFRAWHYKLPPAGRGPFRLSHARNMGAALSSGDLLFFNDVDIVHEGPALDRISDQAEQTKTYALILPELHFFEGGQVQASRKRIFGRLGPGDWIASQEWLFAWMGWAAVPREIFGAVGGFDQAYWGHACEDMDFGYRAAKVGFKFIYTKKALGVHWPHPDQPLKVESGIHAHELFEKKHGFPLPFELIDDTGEIVDLRYLRKA